MTLPQLAAAILAVVDALAEQERQRLPSVTTTERTTLEKIAAQLQALAAQKGAA